MVSAATAAVICGALGMGEVRAGARRDDRDDALYQSLALDPKFNSVGSVTWNFGLSLGTGTLISPKWVLTAAHVVDSSSTRTFRYGSSSFISGGLTVSSNLLLPHPGFSRSDILNGNDIGLMRLSSAISNITPANRFTGSELGNLATTVGFGQTGDGNSGANTLDGLKRAGTNVIDAFGTTAYPEATSDSYWAVDFDNPAGTASVLGSAEATDREYCAGGGDSGGGSFIDVNGKNYVAGVTSFLDGSLGDGTDNGNYSDTFGSTRVTQFNTWIDDAITVRWLGSSSGSFATNGNWSGGAAPGVGDIAGFNAPGTWNVTLAGNITNHRLLSRDGNVTLNLNGKIYTLDANNADGSVIVGKYSGNNTTLTITGGGTFFTREAILAQLPGSTGTINVGPNGNWVASGAIRVGGSLQSGGGAGTLNVGSTGTLAATGALDVFAAGVVNVTGGALSAGDSRNDGALTLSAGSVALGNLDGTGTTALSGGTLTAKRMRQSSLVLSGSARAITLADGGAAGVTRVGSLSIAPTAGLDLADNDLIVDSGSFSTIHALVIDGIGETTGINSSTSSGSQILALFDNALVNSTQWLGEPIPPAAIVGKYTYFGDLNIDGQVSGDDYTVVDAHLNTDPALGLEWLRGDANLDGIVTGDDYTIIDANLGLGESNPLALSSLLLVPEPSGLMLLAPVLALYGSSLNQRSRRGR
jgi:hypothetical protein